MRHLSSVILMAVCLVALLGSCSKAKNIMVEQDNVVFAINGGEKTITVNADGNYDVMDCPEWVQTSVEESTLTIIVGENTTGAKRECVIRLVGKDVEVPVTIFQADKCTYINVSETTVTIPKDGGEVTLDVESDGGDFSMKCPEGVEATLKGRKLTISAPANNGGTIKGDLTITSDNVTSTVKVTVEGNVCPRCNGTGYVACSVCGGKGYTNDYTSADGDMPAFTYHSGCTKCGGYGYLEGDNLRKGSGRMTCPDCGGTGR